MMFEFFTTPIFYLTPYLNVDALFFRISWADFLNGVGVFALTSLALGLLVSPKSPAETVAKVAGIAALITIFTDTFF